MEFRWLTQGQARPGVAGQNNEAIVVFGGWAIGAGVFDHLTGPYDVLFASDYRDLDAGLPDLSGYDRVSLVAWSFGIASYAHWQQGRGDPFVRKVAVNGTLTPVHRTTGVPPVAMTKTMQTLSPESYQLFLARAFNAQQPEEQIDVSARRDELQKIEARGDAPDMAFDRVWIGSADKIFPTANQFRAWPTDVARQIKASHASFGHFRTWQELLA
ncbi:biotin synthase [Rhodobacterales bacterium 56_14_T64]|nr:biotin synthase [Rhodobacterales bacterium 56_14_T64]